MEMRKVKYLFFIVILYLFLYNPVFNFVKIESTILLYFIVPIFYIQNIGLIKVFRRYKVDFACYTLLITYILIRVLLGADNIMLKWVISALIDCLILPVFLVTFYLKCFSKHYFYRVILIVGSIAAIISTVSFFNLEINSFFRSIQQIDDKYFYVEQRGFGLSNGLLYSYSIIQSIILYVAIDNLKNNKWFLLIIPMLLLSVFFNARVGILVVIIGVFVFLLKNPNVRSYIYILLALGIITLILDFVDIGNINSVAYFWVSDFFHEVNDFFLGSDSATSNTIDVLLYDMFVVPDNLFEWFVGTGRTMFGVESGTDVGYLQLLNYGGLVFLFLFSMLIYQMSKKLLKYNSFYFLIYFLLVLLICEIKGNFIPNSGGFRLICLLYVFIIESNNINFRNVVGLDNTN